MENIRIRVRIKLLSYRLIRTITGVAKNVYLRLYYRYFIQDADSDIFSLLSN